MVGRCPRGSQRLVGPGDAAADSQHWPPDRLPGRLHPDFVSDHHRNREPAWRRHLGGGRYRREDDQLSLPGAIQHAVDGVDDRGAIDRCRRSSEGASDTPVQYMCTYVLDCVVAGIHFPFSGFFSASGL